MILMFCTIPAIIALEIAMYLSNSVIPSYIATVAVSYATILITNIILKAPQEQRIRFKKQSYILLIAVAVTCLTVIVIDMLL